MCFSPQWRAIFRHLNFQKWSKHAVFCTFRLANVFFATAACNFWFLLWAPTSAPAALTGLLFDWPDTRIIEKTQHFATSLTFGADVSSFFRLSRYCIFCRLTWWLYCWAMHLLFNCPYCRKFLFKLPSIIEYISWFRFLFIGGDAGIPSIIKCVYIHVDVLLPFSAIYLVRDFQLKRIWLFFSSKTLGLLGCDEEIWCNNNPPLVAIDPDATQQQMQSICEHLGIQ